MDPVRGIDGARSAAKTMQVAQTFTESNRPAAMSYAGALLAVAAGVLAAVWLQPFMDPTVLLLTAVMVAAWFSGLWPALLASLFATVAVDYFFTPPTYTLTLDAGHIPRLVVFTVFATLFAGTSAARRTAERSLKQSRDELDAKVRERTADLTRTHAEAVAAQQRFRDLVNSIEGIVWEADARTLQFTFVSQQAERVFGYPVHRWVQETAFWKDHVHPDDRESVMSSWLSAADQKQDRDLEYRMMAADGRAIWLRVLLSVVVEKGQTTKLRGVMLDVTSHKQAEQDLEELAGRLIDAQEEERSRIGRELHDHISQMLGVLTIRIDQLRADDATPPPVAGALEELRQSTSELTDDIHSLSHRLHSSALDYLGLVPALQKLVNEFSARHSIAVDFSHASVPVPLRSDVALCLFRVTEESLTNIVKHSHARSARVAASGHADGLRLTIEDNGRGFDVDSLEHRAGLGFVSMRERLRVLRGTVRVDSAASRGTKIDVWVPAASLVAPTSGDAVPHKPSTVRSASNVSS
jgi:PAS domain S-box-containing protein